MMKLAKWVPVVLLLFLVACRPGSGKTGDSGTVTGRKDTGNKPLPIGVKDSLLLDTSDYNKRVKALLKNDSNGKWPVKTVYPLPGALLPFNRVVAYYGNFYSSGMGILGELSPAQLKARLNEQVKAWQEADSNTVVVPAIHYIAVTAQGSNGAGIKYRLRMPAHQIDRAIALADSLKGIVFLDIQVGHSSLQEEIPPLEKYLRLPNVHLGIDAEYSMKTGAVPSTSIGSFDAADVNYAGEYLARLVRENKIPPKILVVHRFTQGMLTNYKQVGLRPEVQIVINMDGFGSPAKKLNTYKYWIAREPVQFAGFKLFYKQDKPVMKPSEVMKLFPVPVYIQYQ